MKFKAGDEVFIKAEITDVSGYECSERPYFVAPDIYSVNWVSEDKIIPADKTYVDGLKDAWELAKKILFKEYGYSAQQIYDIFGGGAMQSVKNLTIEEALAKIEEWKKEKEIKPTDIVEHDGKNWVVTEVYKGVYSLWNGKKIVCTANVKKVGSVESIEPLAELLRQIGE